tara:strand:- start:6642 stop:7928 length:1287 start_codon:yes stop_codon:yes gene_type:complete
MDGIRRKRRKKPTPQRTSTPRSFHDTSQVTPLQHKKVKKIVFKKQPHISFPDLLKRNYRLVSLLTMAFFVFFLILSYGNNNYRSQIIIEPRIDRLDINETISATFEDLKDSINVGFVTDVIQVERLVASDTTTVVETFATGTVRIENTVSPELEKLLPGTRLESSDGRIYRIPDTEVYIPGTREGVPGELEVQITAEEPGEEYNITDETMFTIPGYREFGQTSKYEGITGKSIGPIDGGMIQIGPGLSDMKLNNIRSEMRSEMEQKLQDYTQANPDSLIQIIGPNKTTTADITITEQEDGMLRARLETQQTTLAISEYDLKQYIADRYSYPITIINSKNLRITTKTPIDFETMEFMENELALEFNGFIFTQAHITTDDIASMLSGRDMNKIPSWGMAREDIDSISAKTWPFWKKRVAHLDNITLVIDE